MKPYNEISYETPKIEVVEIAAEKGYAASDQESNGNGENAHWVW